MKLLANTKIFYATPLLEGTLEECLKFNITINSSIPKHFGLPELEKNQCEGVVIKSVEYKYKPTGNKRYILKYKNQKFAEINPKVPLTKYEQKREDQKKCRGINI